MSVRVLPRASDLRRPPARGATPARVLTGSGATPLDPRNSRGGRRIRDDARDGLSAAAVSLGGSLAVTFALWALLRWLG